MRDPISLTGLRYPIQFLREQLEAHPELWNQHRLRTEHPQSPHRETDDIWIRYNAWENYKGDLAAFNGPHESSWYPAADVLSAAREISLHLGAYYMSCLGGILITRIPPGKQVYPHSDHGWHAQHYEKCAVQVTSAPGQAFCFESKQLSAEPGECYCFDNSFTHWVLNPTKEDRITLIVCLRSI